MKDKLYNSIGSQKGKILFYTKNSFNKLKEISKRKIKDTVILDRHRDNILKGNQSEIRLTLK